MGRISWYVHRLRAMSPDEIVWRIAGRRLQGKEKADYADGRTQVWDGTEEVAFDADAVGLRFDCHHYATATDIELLGGFHYADYATRWHAGFQTGREWPRTFCYDLRYKQRDDIGDARTNWELNRHYQFALLAKAYYATGERSYLDKLTYYLNDWNESNPFLIGISWTSVMEVAIRCVNWTIAAAFLSKAGSPLAERMAVGIWRMADYVSKHYSRYSSANNHLLVEACSLVYAGSALGREDWQRLGIRLLDEQLERQNCADGVNREMSLHYQTFGMEAYALAALVMKRKDISVPQRWIDMLRAQCQFVAASMAGETAIEFGDDDEGKIIDLEGGRTSHYRYVLQLCSLLTGIRYHSFEHIAENIRWLFTDEEIAKPMTAYEVPRYATFAEGGYSFLRDKDGRIVMAIDHAPLGFGSIAAHGHADALSFQLYIDGKCILGDPGTFIYHCSLNRRNEYRQSDRHNTITRQGHEQSEMLGAFMWGKRAETTLIEAKDGTVEAQCKRADGIVHRRKISFSDTIYIEDSLTADDGIATFIVHHDCRVEATDGGVRIRRDDIAVRIETGRQPHIDKIQYSERYGIERPTERISYKVKDRQMKTKIWIEKY